MREEEGRHTHLSDGNIAGKRALSQQYCGGNPLKPGNIAFPVPLSKCSRNGGNIATTGFGFSPPEIIVEKEPLILHTVKDDI